VTRVVNDTLQSQDVEVTFGWIRVDGTKREARTKKLRIGANAMIEVGLVPLIDKIHNPQDWVYAATMTGPGIDDDLSIWKLVPCRELNLSVSPIRITRVGDNLVLQSNTFCAGVHLPEEADAKLTDNYFDLLPGVPHTVHIEKASSDGNYKLLAAMPVRR